ncbi:MAG: biotin transporter BioY, partial [Clostridia bacterium]|nr:biotin transporter BioY [Clostridia bacterium]
MEHKETKGVDVRRLALIAVMAAVICVLSPLAIPLSGGVPISLATLAVMLAGAVLGPVDGMLATLVFLALGMVGVPVFSAYQAGIGVLFGKTGGFILGYIPLALCSGLFLGKQPLHRKPSLKELLPAIGGMVLGTVILYAFGTAWFLILTHAPLKLALTA